MNGWTPSSESMHYLYLQSSCICGWEQRETKCWSIWRHLRYRPLWPLASSSALTLLYYATSMQPRLWLSALLLPSMLVFFFFFLLSSVSAARQGKLARGQKSRGKTFWIWMEFRWTTPELCLWCLYREVFLIFLCLSATIRSSRGSCVLYSGGREPFKPLV